jgi:hypothetical protein
VNPRVPYAHSLRKTLLSSLNRSEGSQRALYKGESLVVRVKNNYRSILNAYDAGKEAKTLLSSLNKSEGSQRALYGGESLIIRVNSYRSILNAYDAGREAIWIYLGFRRRRVASYLTPDTTRRCESIISSGCEQPALRALAKG